MSSIIQHGNHLKISNDSLYNKKSVCKQIIRDWNNLLLFYMLCFFLGSLAQLHLIKGGDNFWRSRTEDLQHWITHHVARGHGPPTFFITLSCAENWWIDLKRPLAQLEDTAQNNSWAKAIKDGSMIAMSNASRQHPLFVNKYFMRKAKSFMSTVVKTALGIEHYWGRVEFAPGRGAIHLHIVAIAKDMANF